MMVARQLLLEAMLLSITGGLAGFALAAAVLQALARWQLPLPIPVRFEVTPHLPAFVFAGVVTVLVALGASIAPARRAWKAQPARLTGAGSPDRIGHRWGSRDLLLAGQSFCVRPRDDVCGRATKPENGAGHAARIRPHGRQHYRFDLALAGYNPVEGRQFQQRTLERVAALPGVRAAAYTNSLPLSIDQSRTTVYPGVGEIRSSEAVGAHIYQVSPRYFEYSERGS